jgi:hypothetical protein
VFGTQRARVVGKRRDDVLEELVFVDDVRFVVRDVHSVAADEPYAQHRSRHVVETRRVARLAADGGTTAANRLRTVVVPGQLKDLFLILVHASRWSAPSRPIRWMIMCAVLQPMKRRTSLIISVAMLLIGAGSLAGLRRWDNRPPYGPEALGATATLRMVDQTTADAALQPVTVEPSEKGDQIVLGQVSWVRPLHHPDGGSFRIVVLDKRTRLMPGHIAVTSGRPDDVGIGSDESQDIAQKRYPWLQGAGVREVNGSFWSAGNAIAVSSIDASPVTFAIVLHPARPETPPEQMIASAPAAVTDLLVALINVGPDGQVYWAQRLLN